MQTLLIIWLVGGSILCLFGLVERSVNFICDRCDLLRTRGTIFPENEISFWGELGRELVGFGLSVLFTFLFWPIGVLMVVIMLPYQFFFGKPVEPIIIRSFKGPDGQIHWPNEGESSFS